MWHRYTRKVRQEEIEFRSLSISYRDLDEMLVMVDTGHTPPGELQLFHPYEASEAFKIIMNYCVVHTVSRWLASCEGWKKVKEPDGGKVFAVGGAEEIEQAFHDAGHSPDGEHVDNLEDAQKLIIAHLNGVGDLMMEEDDDV